jgi:outer membrane receptor for ferrienterochelin and colicin
LINLDHEEAVMRWAKASLGGIVTVLLMAAALGAQTSGTISGRINDSSGGAMPGVTINVEGTNLQGIMSVVSTENGDYIVPQLPAGPYTLTFMLSGFERQERKVVLALGQVMPLNVTLGPATLTETVNVVASASSVLTQTAQVATSFKQEMIALLPTNRTLDASVLRAPGVHPTGPSGNYSIGGAMSFESLYMVNGVTVNENIRGTANTLYIEDAIQETTVSTSGISAEYGRFSGGVVNVITKSGGNLFSASFRDTLYNDNWRSLITGNANFAPLTGTQTIAACNTVTGVGGTQVADPHCFSGDTKLSAFVPQYEGYFGGPIVKDRLWFFVPGRFISQQSSLNTIAPLNIPYAAEDKSKRFEVKLTGALTSSHRLDGDYTKEVRDQLNNTFSTATSMDLASLYDRQLPQNLYTMNYRGVLSPKFFVEARLAVRHFSFIGSGAQFTDLIKGTLLIDRARGSLRYWSPTFCGVCDPEQRDNDEQAVKGTYFLSTKDGGSHTMVAGYNRYNDKRFANNHQSGSDYRILGTTSIVRDGVIYPQFLPTSTTLQFNPILRGTDGTNFRTHSVFFNDNWRVNTHLTANLGVRWDKNDGANSAGESIVKDSAFSPRFGVVWDPKGDGVTTFSGSVGQYVAAISGAIADGSSVGGNPATFTWTYSGPSINPDTTAASLLDSATGIQRVFDWCNRDSSGLCRQALASASIPGVSLKIADNVKSPNVFELAGGVSRQLGPRAVVRADYAYRKYRDFYAAQVDSVTGTVTDQFGNRNDLEIDQNTNVLKRRYSGATFSASYRLNEHTDIGGNYTLSQLWGNFNGENVASGPVTSAVLSYPEYHRDSWFVPEGNLEADQRHRASIWVTYGIPHVDGLSVSALQDLASGTPYGAAGTVDARPYVPASIANQYATPQGGSTETYYYTARDAFRTEATARTDIAANYSRGFTTGGHKIEGFIQAQILNLFNAQDLCGCGGTVFSNGSAFQVQRIGQGVLSPANNTTMVKFDPFNITPVQGVNWNYNANFGTPLNRFAFTSPRTFRLGFGVRF